VAGETLVVANTVECGCRPLDRDLLYRESPPCRMRKGGERIIIMSTLIFRCARLLVLCLPLAAPGVLSAASILMPGNPMAHQRKVFEEIDVDKDGKMTEAEFVNYELRRRFERADVNKDGRLSKEEYLASIKNEVGERQANSGWKLINGGKKFVTVEDVMHNERAAKEISGEFKKLDRTGRGYVTMAEWTKGKRGAKRPTASR
jgi:Ca2+-binding EF-hand superfamily protein